MILLLASAALFAFSTAVRRGGLSETAPPAVAVAPGPPPGPGPGPPAAAAPPPRREGFLFFAHRGGDGSGGGGDGWGDGGKAEVGELVSALADAALRSGQVARPIASSGGGVDVGAGRYSVDFLLEDGREVRVSLASPPGRPELMEAQGIVATPRSASEAFAAAAARGVPALGGGPVPGAPGGAHGSAAPLSSPHPLGRGVLVIKP